MKETVEFTQTTVTAVVPACSTTSFGWYYFDDPAQVNVASFYCLSFVNPISIVPSPVATIHTSFDWWKFQSLVGRWRGERGASSSTTESAMSDSYLRIIGMGEKAIPLILQEMKTEGDEVDQWFWALQILTEADPVSQEDRGDFPAMARAWLDWAFRNWYLV